jgi:hypothetical protein
MVCLDEALSDIPIPITEVKAADSAGRSVVPLRISRETWVPLHPSMPAIATTFLAGRDFYVFPVSRISVLFEDVEAGDVEESISVCVMGEGRNYTGLAVLEFGGSDAALALARKVQAATAGVTL